MNLHHLRALFPAALLGATLAAQTPVDPPPWWRVNDEVTVSLGWTFSGPNPLQPTLAVVPTWYSATVTRMVVAGPLAVVPNLGGQTDVLALVGTGAARSASLDLTVDNDPHLDWIKIFWFQFDSFEGAGASVVESIEQDLAKYERASVSSKSVPIGNGWERVTVTAQLIPQPDDEGVDWSFATTALGTAAIDNLFVNSKCVKPGPDETGDALGQPDTFQFDLTAATGRQCLAAAVTEGPAPTFVRTWWVGALAPTAGASHQIFRLNAAGQVVGQPTTLPATLGQAPNGPTDLAVETVVSTAGVRQQFVYAVLDTRTTPGGNVRIVAMDGTGALLPTRDVVIANFPSVPSQLFGLAFEPSGDLGAGTFWITTPGGNAFEFSRAGTLLQTRANLPTGVTGAGYDDVLGNFYFWSRQQQASPSGPVQLNGYEWSGYDFAGTGVRFCGDLRLQNPGGSRGGIAGGLDAYRRQNGAFRLVCVAQLQQPNRSVLYELKGPYRFGWNLLGTCGMRGGPPFEGATNFQVTLSGVPGAAFAALYAGFSNTTYLGQTLPRSLLPFGLPESNLSISLDLNSVLQAPVAPGEFAFTLPLPPPGAGFAYVPLFFQWVVFDPTAPGGIATSQAGKSIVY